MTGITASVVAAVAEWRHISRPLVGFRAWARTATAIPGRKLRDPTWTATSAPFRRTRHNEVSNGTGFGTHVSPNPYFIPPLLLVHG